MSYQVSYRTVFLGPKFVYLVLDKLLHHLEQPGYGCHVEQCVAGVLAYTDDLILLSGLVVDIELMLQICYEFGVDCNLLCNHNKCFCGLGD
jgi:hypothetical protein